MLSLDSIIIKAIFARMKQRIIIIIIATMAVAFLGLATIQTYWIRNAILIKEVSFRRSAEESVSEVVQKVEKMAAGKRLKKYKESGKLYRKIDSLNFLINNRIKSLSERYGINPPINVNVSKPRINPIQKGWRTLKEIDSAAASMAQLEEDAENSVDSANVDIEDQRKPDFEKDPILVYLYALRDRVMEELMKKSFLVDEVYQNFIENEHLQPIERRINAYDLDSMLYESFQERGISTIYEFGVFSPLRNSLVIEKTGDYSAELLNKAMAIQLFPNDINLPPNYLMVYFPYEKGFVLSKIWWILAISGILIIAIVWTFSYTILTIIRQKKLSEMKNDFINNMTHEFKTPISTISLACEALTDVSIPKTKELQTTYIGMITEENKRLGSMAEKILQTAILDKGRLKMKLEKVNIHEVILSLGEKIALALIQNEGKIVYDLQARSAIITADRIHITNLVNNLLDNAVKYSTNSPLINIRTFTEKDSFVLEVKDNGIGISKADQKRIFDKLFRVNTGNLHDVKGFGLGLSYVKAISELHHGSIQVESEIKNGSLFRLRLPIER
ncbi:MAG: HAMP domain-containing sensor histidine kinase [Bacteroidales bacterium]|nr:HAMP domain-containing sensor histidine kinase [Bacteroidales bacterium]